MNADDLDRRRAAGQEAARRWLEQAAGLLGEGTPAPVTDDPPRPLVHRPPAYRPAVVSKLDVVDYQPDFDALAQAASDPAPVTGLLLAARDRIVTAYCRCDQKYCDWCLVRRQLEELLGHVSGMERAIVPLAAPVPDGTD